MGAYCDMGVYSVFYGRLLVLFIVSNFFVHEESFFFFFTFVANEFNVCTVLGLFAG